MFGYLDCFSGVSGDKFLGALLDAGLSADLLRERLTGLDLDGWALDVEETLRGGLRATLVRVRVSEGQPARSWRDIRELVTSAQLPDRVRDDALRAFGLLAAAEAKVHGVPLDDVHFHEVGAVDSIVDIVGVAIGLQELGVGEMWASPVRVGHGTVETQHGLLPVPAPATAELLVGVPTYAGEVAAEMTTPTGAALLRAFVTRYAPAPPAQAVAIGYGAGSRDPSLPNVLRLTLSDDSTGKGLDEQVALLETVIDHMAPEHLATALELVLEAGALDVWQTPVVMKKGRLASAVTVLARPEDAARLSDELARQTGTLGVRRTFTWRAVLERRADTVATSLGQVRVKIAGPRGDERVRVEAADIARIARETGEPVADIARRLALDLNGSGEDQSPTE